MRNNGLANLIDTIIHMVIFGSLFILVGRFVPEAYYRYFDKTQYYSVKVPAPVDGDSFSKCSKVPVLITRSSLIDTTADVNISLVLVNEKTKERITSEKRDIVISKGNDAYIARYNIPCNVEKGVYMFDALVHYKVYDLDKYTRVYTTPFKVIDDLQTINK